MKNASRLPHQFVLLLLAAAGLSITATAADGWLVDFAKAKAQSAKEGKPILMEFTGSDWCPPCKALHKNVLTSAVFKKQMPEKFILLKLDNPRDKSKQKPAEIAQYKKLSSEYKVRGVPTVIIADAKGKEQHRQVGYRSNVTAEQWVAKIMAAVKTGPKVAGPDKPAQSAKPAKPDKVYKKLPGIDLTKYTVKQQATILARANKERCPCGCKLTVAGCRNDDSSCRTGKKLAAKIVEEVTGETPAEPKDKDIGKPLDIQFTATDGTKVDLTKMKGKVVLIDFWATWCGPCIREIPNIKKTYAKLHPKGFEIVGISLDSNKDKLLNFIKEKEMPWVQYFDGLQWKNKISTKYGIRSIPAMWLIDKKGNLVDKNARSGLEGKVEKLLAAKVSATTKSNTPAPKPIAGKLKPLTKEEQAKVIEAAIRKAAKKPTGELTKADYEKVTFLSLKINDAGLKEMAKLTQLNNLYLSGDKITDAGLKEVVKLQKLTRLVLDDTKVTDAGLKEVTKLTQLKTLSLNKTQITDTGLKEVAKLQQLTQLDLPYTNISDTGLKEVAKLQQLKSLALFNTKITDAGLKEVARMKHLIFLNFGNTKITDVGLKELAKLKNLKMLFVNNTSVTKAQIDQLQKALPKCKIYHNADVVADNKPYIRPSAAAADDLPIRPSASTADDLPAKIKALLAKYREMRAKDPEKAGAQAIKDSGKLARENPNEPRPWGLYLSAANFAKDPKEKRAIIEEVAANKSPKLASLVARAKGELSKLDALGKPVDIKFTAIDGREVDLAKMKGKVVLIDFWATWCGPCVREIPNVVRSYDKFHSRGFEIIGISLERDKDPKKLLAYVKEKKMPWPQYHDGLFWNNKLSKKYGIRSIPAMWLVDKKGNLVDMNARSGLEAKVEKLLATEAETTPKP